jgi:hypothetical protein
MSHSNLEISLKPNIFYGNYQERLKDWQQIRNIINELSDPTDYLVEVFKLCPRTKTTTDPYKSETWLTGWQLIERNEYDLFDICLLLSYTIILTDNFKKENVKIHTVYKKECDSNNRKFSYIIEMKNSLIDAYSMAKLNNLEFDNNYIRHYTTDIHKTINIKN